jgi:hypothetical protein
MNKRKAGAVSELVWPSSAARAARVGPMAASSTAYAAVDTYGGDPAHPIMVSVRTR